CTRFEQCSNLATLPDTLLMRYCPFFDFDLSRQITLPVSRIVSSLDRQQFHHETALLQSRTSMDLSDRKECSAKEKLWCLLCGKFKSEHLGSCTTKMRTCDVLKCIREQGVEPGQPLTLPSGKAKLKGASNKVPKLEFIFYKNGKEKGIFYEF
ncbi:Protein of unknown function, partial [Gryllus bimaculatus]